MCKTQILMSTGIAAVLALSAYGAPILHYDSNTDGIQLERIDSVTDATLVSASDVTTSSGSNTTFIGQNTTATNTFTVGLGSGKDMQYRFGGDTEALDSAVVSLEDSANTTGNWVGFNFTAAQAIQLNEFSFKLYVNSQGGNWSARDAALYVRIGNSGNFTLFGTPYQSPGVADQGKVVFTGEFPVPSGSEVQLRLAFTDRTNIAGGAQTRATRLGSFELSARKDYELVADSVVPGSGPVVHNTNGTFTRTFGQFSANPYFGRGQTFTTADAGAGNDRWSVGEISLLSKAAQTFTAGDKMRVWVFKWLPSSNADDMINWTTDGELVASDGLADGDPLSGTTVGEILLDGVDFDMPLSMANGDFLHFRLATLLELDENSAYGTFFEFIDADGGSGSQFVTLGIGASGSSTYAGGRELRTTATANSSQNEDMTFYVSGTALAAPPIPDLTLASPFQDGMILQRDKSIAVWGSAPPNEAVMVAINGTSTSGVADGNGDWKIDLPALSSGGPYTLEVTSGEDSVVLQDVLVGDVWFAFGQSNMVRPLNEMINATFYKNAITNGDLPIRCLKITQRAALSPQDEGAMTWLGNDNPGSWTSVGAVFAYQMYQATGVPTAIIWSAWGSTSLEGWMPTEMEEQFPHFKAKMDDYRANDEATVAAMLAGTETYNDVYIRTRPNIVYNQMAHPLRRFGISGFVWYQGEANAGTIQDSAQYGFTFPAFVRQYRSIFGQGDLPFLAVQLPSYNRPYWPWFREAQNRVETEPSAYTTVTIDTGLPNNIHPFDKEPIGIRLSLLARKHVYGESIVANGPVYESMSISGNVVTLQFSEAAGLTTDDTLAPATFEVASASGNFVAATSAVISGTTVQVSASSVSNPAAVRYAWSPAPVNEVNLVNAAGLPAAPFRTDNRALPDLAATAPAAVNDSYTFDESGTLSVSSAEGVLVNDIDLNRDVLTATVLAGPTKGSLTLSADGSFVYKPLDGFTGADSFTYTCSDGALSSTATVSISGPLDLTGFVLWRNGIGWDPADDQEPDGDPDFDGASNFLEYALVLDPVTSDGAIGSPGFEINGANVEYTFRNLRAGVSYEVLLSSDLATWEEPAFVTVSSGDAMPVMIPISEGTSGKLFVRLRVSE
ncbi:MAG: Ig-like domain-containing protein [Akkermansiaceae bacterium]|nr:Ig-like domain-containing protein [Akkermansiaceae bacterium]